MLRRACALPRDWRTASKLMNELEAEVGGEVVEILVDNGTPVEFGQVLMRVKPG